MSTFNELLDQHEICKFIPHYIHIKTGHLVDVINIYCDKCEDCMKSTDTIFFKEKTNGACINNKAIYVNYNKNAFINNGTKKLNIDIVIELVIEIFIHIQKFHCDEYYFHLGDHNQTQEIVELQKRIHKRHIKNQIDELKIKKLILTHEKNTQLTEINNSITNLESQIKCYSENKETTDINIVEEIKQICVGIKLSTSTCIDKDYILRETLNKLNKLIAHINDNYEFL